MLKKTIRYRVFFLSLLISMFGTAQDNYYSLGDFATVDKIDTHIHVSTHKAGFVEQARKDNFKLLNIVVDLSKGHEFIKEQYGYCMSQKSKYPDDFEVVTSFSIADWDNPDWVKNTISWLKKSFDEGAVGVKVWKNIGMVFRDKNGKLVTIDDPKFDSIFSYIAANKKVLVGHLGEPKNCWLPLNAMTVNNDRVYYEEHPQYHMYKHPELPSYEAHIAARDRMLEKNPDLVFVGAHMGSLEWSVDELAERLDKFPNMSIDLAARIGQVFQKTIADRKRVRDFFIKYQDRVLYATDLQDNGSIDPDELQKKIHTAWLLDWQFFVTDEVMTSDRVNAQFKGLKLPKEVVDKIYSKNAKKWMKMFPNDGN